MLMKNKDEVRWLQLSDLHMFDSTKMKHQKKALFKQFKETTDFIVITGDLHQYGTDYTMTIQFLNELVMTMKIEKQDVIIVPGNHDIFSSNNRKEILLMIEKEIENNPDIYKKDLKKLYLAFKKYKEFLTEFYGDIKEGYDFLKNNIYIWDNKIAILCINTALVSDVNHYKPQVVDIYGLEELENRNLPCIAIMHHDYYAIAESQLPFIIAGFRDLNVSATLSGHKHKFSKNLIDLGNNEAIPNYCCAKSISQPGDLWSDVGIIEYRWKLDEDIVRVITYEWDSLNLSFKPSAKFENQENIEVNNKGQFTLKQNFRLRNFSSTTDITICSAVIDKEIEKNDQEFQDFFLGVQKNYLDGILDYIGDDYKKFKNAIDIMERIITYEDKKINFYEVIDMIISCKEKIVLSINGLQGTGKSTFLSLVYFELKQKFEETKVFPILIDLHSLDSYSKTQAKKLLQSHLDKINTLIQNNSAIKFILMFDGADDYVRKSSDLENILIKYVKKNEMKNFAFCIGSADNLPNEMCKKSKLQGYSNKAIYKIEAHRIKKEDDENILAIIKNLCIIYSFGKKANEIEVIKKAINVYTINKIDYRTLLIILRVFNMNSTNKIEPLLGSYFYEYYLLEMNSDEDELYRHAKAAYQHVILKKQDALRNLRYAKIIYNNGITIDFLLSYYFIHLIKNDDIELKGVLNSNFVFTASVNKFIKGLIFNKYKNEQENIVCKLIKAYNNSDMLMKSQICYILGRIKEVNAKIEAKNFLEEKWNYLYKKLFENNILMSKDQDIKIELVLFRTISVSLIWLDYDKIQEMFLNCLLLNEKLNEINRVFYLEYYEDKAYMNGISPTFVDDKRMPVDKTMNYLINNIKNCFLKAGNINKSIYLDIITLFSIYQYRIEDYLIKEKYEIILIDIAEKVLRSHKIHSRTITNYVTSMQELLKENPYKKLLQEVYQVKTVKREGWIQRKVQLPESIADHMYGCYILGMFFLPSNIHQCIDYKIPDVENYLGYSKENIIQMLLLHDLAEVKIGDIVTSEKEKKDAENENKRFDYYEFLCSFPKIYGLGNNKKIWEEFISDTTINAKIANDIDKIEPVIQAYFYQKAGNKIDLNEWKEYAHKNVNTSLGKQFLDFVIDKIIE